MLDGPCYTLRDLKADNLYEMVRKELDQLDGAPRKPTLGRSAACYWSR